MSLKTCLKKIKKTFLYDFGRLVAQTPHEPIHVWKTHVPNAGLRRNFLTMSKTWVSFTRDNECTYFMTALTLSNIFQIIFWVIRGSCFRHLNFLVLSRMWFCLVDNYPGGDRMRGRLLIVYVWWRIILEVIVRGAGCW